MEDKKIVKAHEQTEISAVVEIIPEHIDRKEASQHDFDKAKKQLTRIFGGKRCIVCEMRGETTRGNIESHHIFEWCHANDNDLKMVETTLRALSPFLHGMYLVSKDEILNGKPIPSLWDHPDFKDVPFTTLDDARNQYFLCHAHHQQSTNAEIKDGFDIIGIHHAPFPQWIQYFGLPSGKFPMHHISHEDNLNRKVGEEE